MRLRAGRRELELAGPPLLMGVVNATPDSFSDAGELPDLEARAARAAAHVAAGAAIVDVGGESAVGGRPPIAASEEIERVSPLVERIVAEHDVLVSVDTYKPEVAEAAIAAGAGMVNDVSGLRDPALADVCARSGAALVVMHTRVAPKGTLLDPGAYDDVVEDVVGFLAERVALARSRGVGERADRARPRAGLRQDAGADRRGAAAARRRAGARPARCCWRSRARTSSARSRAAPWRSGAPRRSPRSRPGSTPGRASCASTTSPRRPTSSPSGRCCAAIASSRRTDGLTPDRFPER